jgi:ferredoxin--NADP+ reductase
MSLFLPVTEVEHYTDTLFRIRTERPSSYRYTAGQFTMIGMGDDDINRAYSYTSGPYDDYIEFYSIKVPNGPLTSRLQHVKPGDTIEVGDRPTGTLTLANLELGGNLWMFATGTGIAPFISLLRDPETHDSFDTVNVVWSVRTNAELDAYHSFLQETLGTRYYPTVTQEQPQAGVHSGRIQEHIEHDTFWKYIRPDSDKVMLCGSIDFNRDLKQYFLDIGFTEGNKKTAGTLVQEKAFVSRT